MMINSTFLISAFYVVRVDTGDQIADEIDVAEVEGRLFRLQFPPSFP